MNLHILDLRRIMRRGIHRVLMLIPVEIVDPCVVEVLAPLVGRAIFVAGIGDDGARGETGVFQLAFETVDFFLGDVDFEGVDGGGVGGGYDFG